MSDRKIIYLDDAIDALKKEQAYYSSEDGAEIFYEYNHAIQAIEHLPSAQPNEVEYRKQGEWDMFELITTAWYGKQYYFLESNGIAYSRKSSKHMAVHDAILEFLREIGDE